MYDDHRFAAALAAVEDLSEPFMAQAGVYGFSLRERSLSDDNDPGGPIFVVITDDPEAISKAQADGRLPLTIEVGDEAIEVIVEAGRIEAGQAHTSADDPMCPGSNIGTVTGYGTLGAPVTAQQNGKHVITAGHVVGSRNTVVYQPGHYGTGATLRRAGAVIANRYPQHDVALVRINNPLSVDPTPHDSPPPMAMQPAVGLFLGFNDTRQYYMHLSSALGLVSASMPHVDTVHRSDWNRHHVYASGARSGLVHGEIVGGGAYRLRADVGSSGPRFVGFEVKRAAGGYRGDSGAVAIIYRGQQTTWTNDGFQSFVSGQIEDDARDYVPSAFRPLDSFLQSDGSGLEVDGQTLDQNAGKAIIRKLIAVLRQLGKLELLVSAETFQRPCRAVQANRMPRTRPTRCKEIIIHEGEESSIDDEPLEPGEEIVSKTKCCTFGDRPVVTITGDDTESTRVNIAVTGSVSITVEYTIQQRVERARFRRYGYCYKKICGSPETLVGRVWLRRKSRLKISVVGGRVVELPFFGPIQAGAAGFDRSTNTPIQKDFKIPCKKP